jgi:multidrug transporter EmrE-like cation transporter
MNTGENEQGLRKIMDLTRWISIALLLLHFYYECYGAFQQWGLESTITDSLLRNVEHTGLFQPFVKAKLLALLFLLISLLGARGRKDEKLTLKRVGLYAGSGLLLFFGSGWILAIQATLITVATAYIVFTTIGFVLVLTGGTILSRIIQQKLSGDVFNSLNETFPQEERLLQNEYSINLPACYNLRGKLRRSWINIINPFRGLLVMGTPGSGKSTLSFSTSSNNISRKASACLFTTLSFQI